MSLAPPYPPDNHHARDQPTIYNMFYELGSDTRTLINAAFALTTIGQFFLLLLIATLVLSPAVDKPSAVLLNLLAICFIGSVPQFFLMYTGDIYSPNPSTGLCVTQAALIEGMHFTFAVVSLSLVINVLVEARVMFSTAAQSRYLRMTLVAVPYAAFGVLATTVAAFAATHPEEVSHMPNDLACTLSNPSLTTAVQVAIAAIVVITLMLETYAIIHTIATRRNLLSWRRPKLLSFSQAVRLVGFTCFQALLLLFSTLRMNVRIDTVSTATVVVQALMPIATFCIFGLTTDCCHAWKALVQEAIARSKRPLSRRAVTAPSVVVVNMVVTVETDHGWDLESCASKSERASMSDCEDDCERGLAPEKPIRIPLEAHVIRC
ncbi:hypothetical protein C2E23DRAFT_803477 [Lenzites betulinus]|nr:hypothetical protein C2E23DRAFT_803477 [Lenzites betulinus]